MEISLIRHTQAHTHTYIPIHYIHMHIIYIYIHGYGSVDLEMDFQAVREVNESIGTNAAAAFVVCT